MFDPAKSWIFHIGLGWVYPIELSNQSVWLYNDKLKWIWTKESTYPWLYFHTDEVWRYYLNEKGFYDEKQKEWIELSP
jgi:hypothetical protein